MTGIETAAISLGAVIVKGAVKIWTGDRPFAADVTSGIVDLLADRVTSKFEQRRINRFFEDCTDIVAKRLTTLMDAEYRSVPDNERTAALLAVTDTFARTGLTNDTLFEADLDARLVERQLRPTARVVLASQLLSQGGEQMYWLILRESCAYLVEVITTLPKFQAGVLTELLRRDTTILSTLTRILDRLPERRSIDDFTADYGRVVANKLDRLELFGVTLADANRRYPLSIAYLDLSVVRQVPRPLSAADAEETGPTASRRAESVLAEERLALVTGPAGSGKTTLLQWLAVRSARGDFSGPLATLNGTAPFFIPLRRHVDRELPAPQDFPATLGPHIANEMPPGWVHQLLRDGRALVLVDGVDEMPEGERDRVRTWLTDLVTAFPGNRWVITSRPAAIEAGWLDELRFTTTELQQMSMPDVAEFVRQWHAAVGAELLDAEEKAELSGYERSLLAAIETDRHLRALAVSPLLCALVCALNRERRTHLPGDRMETYAAALDMLLDRRDSERGVASAGVRLSRGDKVQLLQDIAFWLVRNGLSDAPAERIVGQVARTAQHLRTPDEDPHVLFRALLERSGLLREPSVRRIDFIHRTFQDYLAGKAAAETDEVGLLLRNAHDDQWRDVVVMAAGHARPELGAELLTGLLHPPRHRGQRGQPRGKLALLALAAAQSAPRIDPQLRVEIDKVAQQLVPPATDEAAEALAGTGEALFGMLRARPPHTEAEAAASIRAVSTIGGPGALTAIREILGARGEPLDGYLARAVLNAWRFFKPEVYVREVLVPCWPAERELEVSGSAFIRALSEFTELAAIRCELGDAGEVASDVRALAVNKQLRRVAVADCGSDLDLGPLRGLPRLEAVLLDCLTGVPDLSPLAGLPLLREVELAGPHSFDVSALRDVRQLMLRVPAGATVTGAELLGEGSVVANGCP